MHDMEELGEDDIPEVDVSRNLPKAIGAKEGFQSLPKDDPFRRRHNLTCETCDDYGDDEEKGPLIYCQGCSVSYHQKCLGPRNTRDHLATKIHDLGFVLQCRRCIDLARTKDVTAPKQSACQHCHQAGDAMKPFRARQTTREEQKAREGNDGEDPSVNVSHDLVNNPDNVLFRCVSCHRAFHWHHLPSKDGGSRIVDEEQELIATNRFNEYSKHWSCHDCEAAPAEVDALMTWRPVDTASFVPGTDLTEDEKEYLVKYKDLSYFKCTWKPGPWIWGVTSAVMRKAFHKREEQPKMRTEDAIPEEYLRVDIIFDVEYTNVVKVHDEKIDRARIKEVKRALVKFKGLGYEDVVWEEPPSANHEPEERWTEFRDAYYDWVTARYVHVPKQISLNAYVGKLRSQDFEKIMMKKQPNNLTGGELMEYQMEGLNWLYYQWHKEHNAILADEMGLGKTIQVIGFLASLKLHGCWPFLIVVPNSTCANWRREIKLWAPSLRVVTYFGSAEAKRLALKHELFHGHSKDLKCHVLVTSYDAAQDEEFRKVFRGVNWRGLVVDEGQRLKNDKNLLYGALNALKIPFKLLLTGTPLQNNPRELFNLLQFLDTSIDAEAMEEEYTTLTKENVPKLHGLLRPFFLRRTKAQVLDFLPSMAQIIIPVTLTVLQKKLYKSILAKNQELIKSIFGGSTRLVKTERANLNNILMQLRKCLCHPFVYSRDIEERSTNSAVSHRNLVDASSKLQLLETMLPKLQERGHRVLIFSQFLDMLDIVEDFMDGLGLYYQRLDGSMNSLQKQKRIDEFNAPNSPLFAFLLSTRAGGVGINLATADTVIILDPDFNPHQDIQALSRAHRIGQKKKVLVFQLTTRATAEEKIMQIGKKKMALDHVLIEQMDAEDDAGMDLESILRHGTEALFQDDSQDIRYDSISVDKLLDRSQVEDTQANADNSAESQFSFARVWANDKATLEDNLGDESNDRAPDPSLWEKILKEREEEVAQEAKARAEALGRGKRKRQTVAYAEENRDLPIGSSPAKRTIPKDAESDTDFQARADTDVDSGEETTEDVPLEELNPTDKLRPSRSLYEPGIPQSRNGKFKRVRLTPPTQMDGASTSVNTPPFGPPSRAGPANVQAQSITCLACGEAHPVGFCPLKLAGIEFCPICALAHFGHQRTCPHLNSVTQCRLMLDAIKQSPEAAADKHAAKKYVVGIIGDLQQRKKRKEAKQSTAQVNSIPRVQMPQGGGGLVTQGLPTQTFSNWQFGEINLSNLSVDQCLQFLIAGSHAAAFNGSPYANGTVNGTAPFQRPSTNGVSHGTLLSMDGKSAG